MRNSAATPDIHRAIDVLGRLTELYRQRREQIAHCVGLSEQQWLVLEKISTEHFMPSMFARARESSPAAVSKILRQLSEKQLIEVSVKRGDARQRDYHLTARGRRVMRELQRQREQAIASVWSTLGSERVRRFAQFSEELSERLERYIREQQRKARSSLDTTLT